MQFMVYHNLGKSVVYPLLSDVISDILRHLNRSIAISLLPVEKYPSINRPERMIPFVRLIDVRKYAVMTHEPASIHLRASDAEFCEAAQYRTKIKSVIDFLVDGISNTP